MADRPSERLSSCGPRSGLAWNELLAAEADMSDEKVDLKDLRAAVDELIEAEKENSAALASESEAESDGDDDLILNAMRRLQWAADRHANALWRVRSS